MRHMLGSWRGKAALAVVGAGLAGAAFAQAAQTVVLHNNVVSRDVITVKGRPYVPLADMAKAVGGFAVKSGANWEIKVKNADTDAAGSDSGAGDVTAAIGAVRTAGKIGDVLSSGKWGLQVADFSVVDSYAMKSAGAVNSSKLGGNADINGATITAKPDYSLVVVNCKVTNGQKQAQVFGVESGRNTALVDDQGKSYQPIGWDSASGSGADKAIAPGASANLTAIFLVPFGTHPASATFTLGDVSDSSPTDVHVSLDVAQ